MIVLQVFLTILFILLMIAIFMLGLKRATDFVGNKFGGDAAVAFFGVAYCSSFIAFLGCLLILNI